MFQRLRNFVDSLNCSKLPSFQPERLKEGFSNEMIAEARDKLKINKVFFFFSIRMLFSLYLVSLLFFFFLFFLL